MSIARKSRIRIQRGFSLLELMVAVGILMLVMGVILQQVNLVQKRYRTEEAKVDISAESREFVDQVVRDVRQAGFPSQKLYGAGVLMSPWQQDSRAAVGLVKFSYTDLWLEADADGDGQVESIRYTLVPGGNGTCPCTLKRSQVLKVNATAPMAQITSYSTGLDGVVNSAGAGGGGANGAYTISGTTLGLNPSSNNTIYGPLAGTYIFKAYDINGVEVGPADIVNNPTQLASIKTIAVSVNVLVKASSADLQTKLRPALSLNASARVSN